MKRMLLETMAFYLNKHHINFKITKEDDATIKGIAIDTINQIKTNVTIDKSINVAKFGALAKELRKTMDEKYKLLQIGVQIK